MRRTPEGRILLAGLALPDQGPNDGCGRRLVLLATGARDPRRHAALDRRAARRAALGAAGCGHCGAQRQLAPQPAHRRYAAARMGRSIHADGAVPSATVQHPRGGAGRTGMGSSTPSLRGSMSRGCTAMPSWGLPSAQGRGAVRAWVDVERGQLDGRHCADVRAGRCQHHPGRDSCSRWCCPRCRAGWGGGVWRGAWSFSTQKLQFTTRRRTALARWQRSHQAHRVLPARGQPRAGGVPGRPAGPGGCWRASPIACRWTRRHTRHCAPTCPRGWWNRIEARRQGPLTAPRSYQARGRVSGLSLAGRPQKHRGEWRAGPGDRCCVVRRGL
jgi:hypothetical protein